MIESLKTSVTSFLTNVRDSLLESWADLTELPWWGWLIVAALLIGGVTAFIAVRGTKKTVWTTRMLAVGAMCIALSSVLSCVKFYSMPSGGSVTAASMLPVMLFAFVYGPGPGLTVGLVYGVMQFLLGGWFLNVWQMLLEYPIAFGVLGLAGLTWKMKNQHAGLALGMVIACAARWFCATLAGIVFWGDFTNGAWAAIAYSIGYNASYMVPECIICVLLGLVMGKRLVRELRKVK